MPYQLTLRLTSLKRQKIKKNKFILISKSDFEKNKCWLKSAFSIDKNCFNPNIHYNLPCHIKLLNSVG